MRNELLVKPRINLAADILIIPSSSIYFVNPVDSAKTVTKYTRTDIKIKRLECGAMPNVMAALPNIDGGVCSTPQSLADAYYWGAVQ